MARQAAWKFAAILVAAGLLALAFLYHAERRAKDAHAARMAELENREKELLGKLTAAEERLALALAQADEPDLPPAVVAGVERALPKPDDSASRLELIRMLNDRQERLAAAQATLAELHLKVQETEIRIASLTQETQVLAAAEKDVRERLDNATRLSDALQAETKTSSARLAQLQVANRDLLRRNEDAWKRLSRLALVSEEMDELNSRREVYLSNILRRYREVTDFYRNLALRLDNPDQAAAPVNTDLARVQNTINLVDEDLRQLRALGAQASRLLREMNTARAEAQKQ